MDMSFLTDGEMDAFTALIEAEPNWHLEKIKSGQTPDEVLWERWRAIADTQDWDLFKLQILDSHASMAQAAASMLAQEEQQILLFVFSQAWVVYLIAKLIPHASHKNLPLALQNNHRSPMVVQAAKDYLVMLEQRGVAGGPEYPTWDDAQAVTSAIGLAWQNVAPTPA